MITAIAISIMAPLAVGVAILVARDRLPKLAADARGIALQTVIVMVVLLAIAGAVAGVLLTRGNEAVTDIENQNITRDLGDYTTETLCDAAGGTWTKANATKCA